ncbi:MAG: GtrA family protein [Alphaproteobacteria bacterium]|nr:GtrA family protein [Alphaproteobacteria bacterium]
MKNPEHKIVRKEIGVFLIVGTLTVLVDFASYNLLLWLDILVSPAKAAGFITGTVFAYFANRFWTFGHKNNIPGNSAFRFVLLYGATLCTNVLVNKSVLEILSGMTEAIDVAFVIATGVSAALNFVGMKFFVFRTSAKDARI